MGPEAIRTPNHDEQGFGVGSVRRTGSLGRLLAVATAAVLLLLAGCASPGNVSQASIVIGESSQFSQAELKGAADAVLEIFRGFEDCTLVELTFSEGFSQRQRELASPSLPEGTDAVVFDSEFWVGSNGQNNGFSPNSTYRDWTWTVTRADPSAPWTVTNWGVA